MGDFIKKKSIKHHRSKDNPARKWKKKMRKWAMNKKNIWYLK